MVRLARRFFFQAVAEGISEPGLAARITGRLDCFLMELDQALRVGERSVFFAVTGCRKEEDLSLDLFGIELAALDFRSCVPPRTRLCLNHVAHDKPFQIRERLTLEAAIRRSDRGVLSHDEEP